MDSPGALPELAIGLFPPPWPSITLPSRPTSAPWIPELRLALLQEVQRLLWPGACDAGLLVRPQRLGSDCLGHTWLLRVSAGGELGSGDLLISTGASACSSVCCSGVTQSAGPRQLSESGSGAASKGSPRLSRCSCGYTFGSSGDWRWHSLRRRDPAQAAEKDLPKLLPLPGISPSRAKPPRNRPPACCCGQRGKSRGYGAADCRELSR